jgi:hypothetical protein
MVLLFLPFISMLSPRAHELEVVSEEEEEHGKIIILGDKKKRTEAVPKECLYNHKNQEPHGLPQEAYVTTFLHKKNYG